MAKEKVFVAIRMGGMPEKGDVLTASSLKGACDQAGLNYNTVKAKDWVKEAIFVRGQTDKNSMFGDVWGIYRCELVRVKGRGQF